MLRPLKERRNHELIGTSGLAIMKRIIGLTYNVKSDWPISEDEPQDMNAEFDNPQTVEFISQALESKGYRVKRIGNVSNLLSQIDDLGVDIVFNIAEGFSGRNRESEIPVILEMKGIPFVGSDGLTLGITLDKIMAKKCFIADGIPTPRYFETKGSDGLKQLNTIGFPLIVKCRYEGTSKGLSEKSRVEDYDGLARQVDLVSNVYRQGAVVEEFIRGTEFTVAVIGNEHPQALPVVQIQIDGKTDLGNEFYTFARVSFHNVRYLCPAKIPKQLQDRLQQIAVKAYQSVECRDFGRVDFRVDEKGNPYVLEINPLPNLGPEDVFNLIPKVLRITYADMIEKILNFGLERHQLKGDKRTPTIRRELLKEARR